MTEAQHKQNQRAFFRLNEVIELLARPLETDDEDALKRLHRERCLQGTAELPVADSLPKRPKSFDLVAKRYPEILAYIEAIEEQAEKAQQNATAAADGKTLARQLVNISGNGIRFNFNQPVEVGSHIELVIRLGNGFTYTTFAEVMRCNETVKEDGETVWSIAAMFTYIREADQDEVIRYLLDRQRENVRIAAI